MDATQNRIAADVRARLMEVGGRTSSEFGLGRIVGQMLVYLYLKEGTYSLDEIGDELGLSKAAVSIAARQLAVLGLVNRVRKPGDRRIYCRTADNIAAALRLGVLGLVRQKLHMVGSTLDAAAGLLPGDAEDKDLAFLQTRIARARALTQRVDRVLNSPLLKLLTK
jgi:DNA-binding transcriptional regulator GbsR (MarR family)